MIMQACNEIQVKKYETDNGLRITSIKTDKFKTNSINLFFHNQLHQSTVTQNALLPMVLRRGSKDYPTMQDISKNLEQLYGSFFDCGVVKKGERQILHFYIDGVNDKYLENDDNLFESLIHMLNSIVSNPLLEGGWFKEQYIQQEKENLRKQIEGRINDKMYYAIERCYELMCAEERYGIHEWGKVEDLTKINGKELINRYNDTVNNCKADMILLGSIEEEWVGKIKRIMGIKTDNSNKVDTESIYKEVREVKTFVEEMDVNQGKLSMGFRTNVGPKDPDYYPLMVYSSILGGGAHSKLFQNVREKASLAYYSFARLDRLKGLMMIGSGIEAQNYDRAKEIILKQVNDIKEGIISDLEFESSIKTLENGFRAKADEPIQMVDFYLIQSILNTSSDFYSTIKKIKQVKPEDVKKVAQKVQLDTVHFIKPRG